MRHSYAIKATLLTPIKNMPSPPPKSKLALTIAAGVHALGRNTAYTHSTTWQRHPFLPKNSKNDDKKKKNENYTL